MTRDAQHHAVQWRGAPSLGEAAGNMLRRGVSQIRKHHHNDVDPFRRVNGGKRVGNFPQVGGVEKSARVENGLRRA